MGFYSFCVYALVISVLFIFLITLVGAVNFLAEYLNRGNSGDDDRRERQNLVLDQESDGAQTSGRRPKIPRRLTGMTRIEKQKSARDSSQLSSGVDLSPVPHVAETISQAETSADENLQMSTLSSAVQFDDSSEDDDEYEPIPSEHDAGGAPEIGSKALIAEYFEGCFPDDEFGNTPRNHQSSRSPVARKMSKSDSSNSMTKLSMSKSDSSNSITKLSTQKMSSNSNSTNAKGNAPVSTSNTGATQINAVATHASPRRKQRRKRKLSFQQKPIGDGKAAVDSNPATGEAIEIQKQHRQIFSRLSDCPRRFVSAIIYHRFFSVIIAVTIVAIVLLLVYAGMSYNRNRADEVVNDNIPNSNAQGRGVTCDANPTLVSTLNTRTPMCEDKGRDTDATDSNASSNKNNLPPQEHNQRHDKSQDDIPSAKQNESANPEQGQEQEKARQLAVSQEDETILELLPPYIQSLHDWSSGLFTTYIWNSDYIVHALEYIALRSPLPPDAWVYIAQKWQWAPLVAWLCGYIILRQLCCRREPKHQINAETVQEKIREASLGFGETVDFEAVVALLVILSSAKRDQNRAEDRNYLRSVVDLLDRIGAINGEEAELLMQGCDAVAPHEDS